MMKSVSVSDAQKQFSRLVQAAKHSTVTLTENGQPAIVMAPADLVLRRRQRAWQQIEDVMTEAGQHASSQGLTDDILSKLLADEN